MIYQFKLEKSKKLILIFVLILIITGFIIYTRNYNPFNQYTNKAREGFNVPDDMLIKLKDKQRVHEKNDGSNVNKLSNKVAIKKLYLNPQEIDKIENVRDAEVFYYKLITTNDAKCESSKRIGSNQDGGWDICFDDKIKLKENSCLAYSFGINNIWEYDDILASQYKCVVRTFDPSMTNIPMEMTRPSGVKFYKIGLGGQDTTWSNGWIIMKMSSFLKKFQESDKQIDILKIDIEYSEWEAFESMVEDGVLRNVKQLLFETHTDNVRGHFSKLADFKRFIRVWITLKQQGFVQWKNHWNHFGNHMSPNTGMQRTCCYEHYMYNSKLIASINH